MRVESIEWLPGAGYTERGLWRVAYWNEHNNRTYRHYAHWRGRDELAIFTLFMKEQTNGTRTETEEGRHQPDA